MRNKYLFYSEIAGWIIIFILDVIVSGSLYIYFRKSNHQISMVTAIFRIIYSVFLCVAIYNLIAIIPLMNRAGNVIEIYTQFSLFGKIWSAGLIIFGGHLLGLGYLSIKSQKVPSVLAYLLLVAGISYMFIHSGKQFTLLSPFTISVVENILALPMALSEILLAVFLIYKGNKKQFQKI